MLVSGYSNGKDNTLILINKGTVPQRINLNGVGFIVNKMKIASMYQENKEVDIHNRKKLTIEPGTLVTLF